MANVLVEESSLSAIADSIRAKNGTATTYKPAEMSGAIDALPTGGGTMQSKSVSYTPSETAQSGTVTPDVGYDGLSRVSVSVGAIDDEYVGSGITRRSVADLDLTGAKFTAPAGYYASDADKTMMTGHMSVSATKGSVSNHSVSVTPKAAVDNAGYFATGDRTGTAVSVSASELVSGSETKTQNGTYDVTNLAELVVNVSAPAPSLQTKSVSYTPTTSSQSAQVTPDTGYDGLSKVNVSVAAMPSGTEGTPTATKGTVSNHSVSVTPSVTNTAGYIAGGTKTGTAVTVSASELDSGTKSITSNGNSQDVVGYAAVNVNVPNSYTSADEGKVVSNGALVAQTSTTFTQNGTYDTTLNDEVVVNVSGGGGTPATVVTVETLPNGADHYIITGVDISDTTAVAADVASGKYFYTAAGIKTAGTASGGDPNENLVKYISGTLNTINCDVTEINVPLARTGYIHHVFLPECTKIGITDAFYSCYNLVDIVLPKLNTVSGTRQMYGCSNLLAADFGGGSIPNNFFQASSKLTMIVLRKSGAVVPLSNTNALLSTPFADGGTGGTLYVPNDLIASYQSANNWSTILGYTNNQIKSIESTHTDPNAPIDLTLYYADGTLIPT